MIKRVFEQLILYVKSMKWNVLCDLKRMERTERAAESYKYFVSESTIEAAEHIWSSLLPKPKN